MWDSQNPFNGLFSSTTSVSWHQKGKPFWILLEQEMMDSNGNGISWTICKLECGPMLVMAALPNIGGAVCLTPKVWLMPTTTVQCSNAAKTWNPLKLAGVSQTTEPSQPLLGHLSSPYYQDMWGRYCCLTSFFLIVDTGLNCKAIDWQIVRWCPDGEFLHRVFSASRVHHVSELHPKLALRPHHEWKYGRHLICDDWD